MVSCSLCGEGDPAEFSPSRRHLSSSWCRTCSTERVRLGRTREQSAATAAKWRANNPEAALLVKARCRAKSKGIPCTVSVHDITIPTHCPILGIELMVGKGAVGDSSPTLDQVLPGLGYIPGNVRVISHLANRRKSDMTIEQLQRIIDYMNGIL